MESSVYQPLSHALNPPPTAHQPRPSYSEKINHPPLTYANDDRSDRDPRGSAGVRPTNNEEEEEEDEVEGAVVPNHMQSDQQACVFPFLRRPGETLIPYLQWLLPGRAPPTETWEAERLQEQKAAL